MKAYITSSKVSQKQKGFGLLDLALWSAIVAALVGGVLAFNDDSKGGAKKSAEITNTTLLANNIIEYYSHGGTYTGMDNTGIITAKLVPDAFLVGAAILNSYRSGITIEAANVGDNGAGSGFTMTTELPQEVCHGVVSAVSKSFISVSVAGTAVKPLNGVLSISDLTEACSGSDKYEVIYTSY